MLNCDRSSFHSIEKGVSFDRELESHVNVSGTYILKFIDEKYEGMVLLILVFFGKTKTESQMRTAREKIHSHRD